MTATTPSTVAAAAELLHGKRLAVLTGAGVSTDSGIPDYRGEGAPPRTPMTGQQFLEDEHFRKRYWAGNQLGWRRFAALAPNPGHYAIAKLEHAGVATGVITQNVDGLHRKAGSRTIVELHGRMDRARCLAQGHEFRRTEIAQWVASANPWLEEHAHRELGPDGDVVIDDLDRFVVPVCPECGGTLKPDVVYFGEFVPRERFEAASELVVEADALVVAGSSLVVNSGLRLVNLAVKNSKPLVVINRGVTRADSKATVRVEGGTSEALSELAERLT